MNYYQEIITQKSWQVLKEIRKQFDFILIGGWAVWLLSRALKSKDIDIIVDYKNLSFLKKRFEVVKNERLKKYEARVEEIEIDIYLPYYSNPGLPPEVIRNYLTQRESFKVPKAEVLLILKQYVYAQRKASIKGQKDKIDIFALLKSDLDFSFYQRVLKENKLMKLSKDLQELLKTTVRIRELNLGNHQLARLRRKIFPQIV